ncbi:hypothetical protein ONZ45_g15551 [Pleurotus djamor]|nr:hypothetical protein ONZ45_g15551 [Pleurotus djamor]
MNSYPPELLTQLAPVMFAAGLDPPEATNTQAGQDPFAVLGIRLREAFLAQRKMSIWQPEKVKIFQVILVDKDARFPPRKTVPPEDPQYPSAHSPLSPLTPTSPLHPDGLIAPIWVRKHTTMVPSVFVLFLRIHESPLNNPRSPLDAPDADREREREQEERRRDAELAAEVALRKKTTNERGIKLTVVLMASRRMLDDPSLDQRLTYILSSAELGDFINSLQEALYESAIEYYTAHSKRVRRKRNRHSHAISTYPNPLSPVGAAPIARPLRSEGWTVRYEYKMACFAEFRGEDEVALKHYQDAYDMLVIMFGSTAILPPRTKRWAEAKVLVDCINIKITKLYLYNNEHALALSHHTTHMRKFGDFSRGWGIGEETFEYWSWMARQYRVLSELLEYGTRSSLVIPSHTPAPPPSAATLAASQLSNSVTTIRGVEYDAIRSLGINPTHALQHPGFYYYMAAKCTEMRRERFRIAFEAETTQHTTPNFPGYNNERKVDHYVIILELYTKSYELFKKQGMTSNQKPSQGRLTLWIAYRIAQTYYDSGKYDMAVRFFERIAKTYRRERWVSMLQPLLSTWYACAQRLSDVELSIKLLLEMIGHDNTNNTVDHDTLQEDLVAVLKSSMPPEDKALVIDLPESQPILEAQVVFWVPEVKVNEPAAFQLSLAAPTHVSISNLPIKSLSIHFSGDLCPIVVTHDADTEASNSPSPRKVHVGLVTQESSEVSIVGHLRWSKGATIVFSGSISSTTPGAYEVTKLVLTLEEGSWLIEVPFGPHAAQLFIPREPRWLTSLNPPSFVPIQRSDCSSLQVHYRPHNIELNISQNAPAYLDEDYPILIEVTNLDDKELDVIMDVLLQPAEIDDAISSISVAEEHSSGLIKGLRFGTLAPGASGSKILKLFGRGAPGDRMIDISIQSRPPSSSDDDDTDDDEDEEDSASEDILDISETLRTLVVPTVAPFKSTYDVAYKRSLGEPAGLGDLSSYEGRHWDDASGGEANITLHLALPGPWDIVIESFKLVRQDNKHAKIIHAFSDEEGVLDGEYVAGDELTDLSRVSLAVSDDDLYELESIDGPGVYEIRWHRNQPGEEPAATTAATNVLLPFLRPPREALIALLSIPPIAQLHKPIFITLSVRNHHPSRSANIFVQLEPDPSDAFVVAGLRSSRLPIILPGGEESVRWRLIPLECGYVSIPRIKVLDKRKTIASAQGIGGPNAEVDTEGEVVKIVNLATDFRQDIPNHTHPAQEAAADRTPEAMPTILVVPST